MTRNRDHPNKVGDASGNDADESGLFRRVVLGLPPIVPWLVIVGSLAAILAGLVFGKDNGSVLVIVALTIVSSFFIGLALPPVYALWDTLARGPGTTNTGTRIRRTS